MSPAKKSKLDGAELEVSVMLLAGISVSQMAKLYGTPKNRKAFHQQKPARHRRKPSGTQGTDAGVMRGKA